MAEKQFVKGPLLPEPQEVFKQIQFNWSTNVSIDGPGVLTDTGYYGPRSAADDKHPAIVVRDGYAHVRAIFILKKNILTEEEWKEIATEAMSRPECAVNGTGTNGIRGESIQKVYKGIKYVSEYPFPELKPAFCLEELYDEIKFKCGGHGPCQNDREHVAGAPGAACKPGDQITYSICASMHCYCGAMQGVADVIRDLERILPTRKQLMLMQQFDEKNGVAKPVDAGDLIKEKRKAAARKGWATRKAKMAAKPAEAGAAQVP